MYVDCVVQAGLTAKQKTPSQGKKTDVIEQFCDVIQSLVVNCVTPAISC